MGTFNAYQMMKGIAENGLKNQTVNHGDFYDEEGMLVCGVCHERRQSYIEVNDPTEEELDRKRKLKVPCGCRCDREREAAAQKAEEDKKAMERVSRLKKASLMDEKFREATFASFRVDKDNSRNLRLCKRFADAFDEMVEKNQGLLMWGDVGTGKTHMAACIANNLLGRGIPVVMTSLVKLLEVIQGGEDRESDIIARMNSAKLVIFDDLGAERSTDYALEKVYNIIDSRYRRKLPMIVTTNLTIEEMKGETDRRYTRIYDRVFEVCYPMQFTGVSWRKKAANKRFREMEKLLDDGGEA